MDRKNILKRSSNIRRFILGNIGENPKGITGLVVKQFKISRQAAARYLKQMVTEGQLTAQGKTKNRSYVLGKTTNLVKTYDLTVRQDESEIWITDFKPLCEDLKENVTKICAYGFTEMVNNAIDHSGGKQLTIRLNRSPEEILISVEDDGVGIFKKIQDAYHLSDERQAILELSKGKLTTDPAKHTGEGIFFTSRIFDDYFVVSHELAFSHNYVTDGDVLLHRKNIRDGTKIFMDIKPNSRRKIKDIFDEFSNPESNYAFDKTIVPVRLAQYEGEELLSRSQAKRLMIRVENFKSVVLDFEGVQSVGPAFADEIFRVYKNEHPNVQLTAMNGSEEVMKMVARAKAADQTP